MSPYDILYKSTNTDALRYTFDGHKWLSRGKRFVPSEHEVVHLQKWPPQECYPPESADFLVLEAAIEANISDPFIWMDSNLFVASHHSTGWLNADVALSSHSETTSWLYKQGMRSYNYSHNIPVLVSHAQVRTLLLMFNSNILLTKCVKTLLVNLDVDRRGRQPIWVDRLPIYRHVRNEQDILDSFPVFLTCDTIFPELLAYVQN